MNTTRNLTYILITFVLLFVVMFLTDTDEHYDKGQALVTSGEAVQTVPTVRIGDTTLTVEILDDALERRKGLSGRQSLEENHGLLFVFDKSSLHGIWMKEMLFPIDILWIERTVSKNNFSGKKIESFYISDVKKDAQPDSYPEIFRPQTPSSHVLEVNSGFLDEYNIKIGDEVKF